MKLYDNLTLNSGYQRITLNINHVHLHAIKI